MINFEPARLGLFRTGIAVKIAMFLAMASSAVAQVAVPPAPGTAVGPTAPGAPTAPRVEATAERVIVTGSNIPTAEEVGPNPVDTYNQDTMAKSGEPTTERF